MLDGVRGLEPQRLALNLVRHQGFVIATFDIPDADRLPSSGDYTLSEFGTMPHSFVLILPTGVLSPRVLSCHISPLRAPTLALLSRTLMRR